MSSFAPGLLIPAAGFLAAIFGLLEVGRCLGLRRISRGESKWIGAVEGAVYGLLGLLLAFSFSLPPSDSKSGGT
ncbi:MAG TPA: hypothetical protein VFW45_05325 [Candidatus Polarisedimenticolia bacterium]|nr:hypothetical protein [Candidatus Polarisedimenticolia bacterium]